MLTECLAAGRGISLPAGSTGGVKSVARVAGAHAAIRVQFGMPIGKFEGIEEPLAPDRTRLTLTHSGWREGDEHRRAAYDAGWDDLLGNHYVARARKPSNGSG